MSKVSKESASKVSDFGIVGVGAPTLQDRPDARWGDGDPMVASSPWIRR